MAVSLYFSLLKSHTTPPDGVQNQGARQQIETARSRLASITVDQFSCECVVDYVKMSRDIWRRASTGAPTWWSIATRMSSSRRPSGCKIFMTATAEGGCEADRCHGEKIRRGARPGEPGRAYPAGSPRELRQASVGRDPAVVSKAPRRIHGDIRIRLMKRRPGQGEVGTLRPDHYPFRLDILSLCASAQAAKRPSAMAARMAAISSW